MDNLELRKIDVSDFEAFHSMMSEYDVVKMTGSWPWPPDPDFTISRLVTPQAKSGAISAIVLDGQYIGQISVVNGELGYMLDKRHWGQGIATWALKEKLKLVFEGSNTAELSACIWIDNPASAAVLKKNGFVKTGDCEDYCKARDARLGLENFVLSRTDWARAQPLNIKTARLTITPFIGTEASELSNLMNDAEIASMMATIPHPFTVQDATAWLNERPFAHEIGAEQGFTAKICLQNGTLIGFVGIGGEPVNTAYALGREFWGNGYITEAMHGFLDHVTKTFTLVEITAGAMFDNPASQRVLEKLGFMQIGEEQHKASGRLEKATLFLYRLARNDRTDK